MSEKPIPAKDAAEFLNIDITTLYYLVQKNKIRYSKPNGGRLYFKREWLEEYAYGGVNPTDKDLEAEADQFMANKGIR